METSKLVVNLGCPRFCAGRLCVDLTPQDKRVVRAEACEFLESSVGSYDEVRSENLLEHLPDVGRFLRLCRQALRENGRVVVITDNAEWLPFYFPIDIPRTGIGAHSVESYSKRFGVVHHQIFTKLHLRYTLQEVGFSNVKVRRIKFGSRLEATGYKKGSASESPQNA